MQYTARYASPLGDILLAADAEGLTGLWFLGQKYYAAKLGEASEGRLPVLEQAARWLDVYFAGEQPDFALPLHLLGTPFQQEVWRELYAIPYGHTVTYGEIARRLAARRGLPHFSAQAVGSAVGRNPISVIVPCHRVVGAGGNLTGYAGGLDKKIALLKLEGAYRDDFHLPPKAGGGR